MQRYEIDGSAFSTLEGFAEHFSARVLDGHSWRGNLDALNDVLRGGFGTPEAGFCLVWRNSDISRRALGYEETARQLEIRLRDCHSNNRAYFEEQLASARRREGKTVFDWLVEIIEDHGAGGSQSEDGIELLLE